MFQKYKTVVPEVNSSWNLSNMSHTYWDKTSNMYIKKSWIKHKNALLEKVTSASFSSHVRCVILLKRHNFSLHIKKLVSQRVIYIKKFTITKNSKLVYEILIFSFFAVFCVCRTVVNGMFAAIGENFSIAKNRGNWATLYHHVIIKGVICTLSKWYLA